jgi:hypothetical protein
MTRKPLLILLALTVLVAITACGKKPPQQAAIQGQRILSAIRDITQAYEKKDLGSFMDAVAKDFSDRPSLEQAAGRVFTKYEAIRFTVQYTKMLMMIADRGNIRATFTWDGEWRTAGGKTVKDGARVTLVFDPRDYKLQAIEGKNPFVPAESPGGAQR